MHGSVIYSTARGLLFTKLPPEEQNAICMVKCGSVIALHFQSLRTLPQTETDTISSPGMQKSRRLLHMRMHLQCMEWEY